MYKLLITYDIDKKDENNRYVIEKYLMNTKYHSKWVHLQGSVWVVMSSANSDKKLKIFNKLLPNSLITVTNVTKLEIKYNEYKECGTSNDSSILTSLY